LAERLEELRAEDEETKFQCRVGIVLMALEVQGISSRVSQFLMTWVLGQRPSCKLFSATLILP